MLERFTGLDDNHIASINSWAAFEGMVKRGTGSKGVDLVLNTVDGEALQVSVTLAYHAAAATNALPANLPL